mmetsp:Transcript_25733/g.61281  ORF Transcript_25733/g.61281 Transcript_25733/m.61281 type:complete len:596 (+) Transcript_25733:104-1891(+)
MRCTLGNIESRISSLVRLDADASEFGASTTSQAQVEHSRAWSLEDLPSPILEKILRCLSVSETISLSLCSKRLRVLVRGAESVWFSLTEEMYSAGERFRESQEGVDSILSASGEQFSSRLSGFLNWHDLFFFLHSQRTLCILRGTSDRGNQLSAASEREAAAVLSEGAPERPLRGVQRIAVSTLEGQSVAACAAVTEGGELMLWRHPSPPGAEAGPVAQPCHNAPFQGRGVVTRCHVDRLNTYAVTRDGDLYVAKHNGPNSVFPRVCFQRSALGFEVAEVTSCSPLSSEPLLRTVAAVVVVALDTKGQLWAWGWAGDLHDNLALFGLGPRPRGAAARGDSTIAVAEAQRLGLSLEASERVVSLSSGEAHFAALTDAGRVFTWGSNKRGQCCQPLGPEGVPMAMRQMVFHPSPMQGLGAGEPAVKASAGAEHTLLLMADGRVLCAGSHDSRRLRTAEEGSAVAASPSLVDLRLRSRFPQLGAVSDVAASLHCSAIVGETGSVILVGDTPTGEAEHIDLGAVCGGAAARAVMLRLAGVEGFQVLTVVAVPQTAIAPSDAEAARSGSDETAQHKPTNFLEGCSKAERATTEALPSQEL